MKLKNWHLFLIITLLFGCSFYAVNQRFDKFYRVNGINSNNRILIEKYLDEDEQTYLIDNQISIDLFIDYIKYDDFYLPYYQYYNALAETSRYSVTELLEIGNQLADRLTYLYSNKAYSYADLLIGNGLELAFLNEENFNFDYIEYYILLKPLYDEEDYNYVVDCENYLIYLIEDGIPEDQLLTIMTSLTDNYNSNSLNDLLTSELSDGVHIVYTPAENTTLVDATHYIGQYEANDLILCQDISRLRYTMYLRSEAYYALKDMYNDICEFNEGFLLREGYLSYDALSDDEAGYNEFQLGLSIDVSEIGISYSDFAQTELSEWLENNAYQYGFILRYPKQKASVTNHSYDAHIYRYVGVEVATYIHENNLTLEEYLGS